MLDIHIGGADKGASFPWETLNALGPHLLWIAFLLWALLWIGRSRLLELSSRVQKFNLAGVEIEFRNSLEQAAENREQVLPPADLGHASRRLARSTELVKGARILWIDDQPENNRHEIALFEEAGARVDVEESTEAARGSLRRVRYDVVISDIARGDDPTAGLTFAEELAEHGSAPPVILYVDEVRKPVPASAFGITRRPDELVHLVLDVLARNRG